MNGSPSTHILKADAPPLGRRSERGVLPDLGETHENADAEYHHRQAGKRTYLLVQRYDRTDVGGRWRRLHQEDYCQALGTPPSAKYESNQTGIRGPTLKDMFE